MVSKSPVSFPSAAISYSDAFTYVKRFCAKFRLLPQPSRLKGTMATETPKEAHPQSLEHP